METVLRVTLIYVFLLVGFRLLGKREFGQLAPFDLVVLLMIPEALQQALVRDDFSLVNAIIAVSTLLSLVFITSMISYRFPKTEALFESRPAVLVQHGSLVERSMNHERVSPGEVLSAMHQSGLERVDQVKWAILGSDGKISIIPWEQGSTIRREDTHSAAT